MGSVPHWAFPEFHSFFHCIDHLICQIWLLAIEVIFDSTPVIKAVWTRRDPRRYWLAKSLWHVLAASEKCYDLTKFSLTYALTNRKRGSCCCMGDRKGYGPEGIQAKEKWVGKNVEIDVQSVQWSWEREDESVANLRFSSLECFFDFLIFPNTSKYLSF